MAEILVAFFSPDDVTKNTTRKVANFIAEITGADTYEIKPEITYTIKDLDWEDRTSRSSAEMLDPSSRPKLADKSANIQKYQFIYLGFPIWWYLAPHIINTFLESYDFTGKTIITFATSDGSVWGKTLRNLMSSCPKAKFIEGKVFRGTISKDNVTDWIKRINF